MSDNDAAMPPGSAAPDTLGIRQAMLALPEQIERSLAAIDSIPDLPNAAAIEHVLILGMGDSGFGGDVAAASARPFSSKPIVVYGGYLPPSWVGVREHRGDPRIARSRRGHRCVAGGRHQRW